jgi:hypothetical protein
MVAWKVETLPEKCVKLRTQWHENILHINKKQDFFKSIKIKMANKHPVGRPRTSQINWVKKYTKEGKERVDTDTSRERLEHRQTGEGFHIRQLILAETSTNDDFIQFAKINMCGNQIYR